MFRDDFIETLPEGGIEAIAAVCEEFIKEDRRLGAEQRLKNFEKYIEAVAMIEMLSSSKEISLNIPKLSTKDESYLNTIVRFFFDTAEEFKEKKTNLTLEKAREKYRLKFEVGFLYQFSDGDLSRIQNLINELRNSISTSNIFEENHKERLLKRLESLQKTLHKKMSNLDSFWGLIGDAGVTLGKFGTNAKPFVDRIREITQIIWRTQARSEELPSGAEFPLLSDDKTNEEITE